MSLDNDPWPTISPASECKHPTANEWAPSRRPLPPKLIFPLVPWETAVKATERANISLSFVRTSKHADSRGGQTHVCTNTTPKGERQTPAGLRILLRLNSTPSFALQLILVVCACICVSMCAQPVCLCGCFCSGDTSVCFRESLRLLCTPWEMTPLVTLFIVLFCFFKIGWQQQLHSCVTPSKNKKTCWLSKV